MLVHSFLLVLVYRQESQSGDESRGRSFVLMKAVLSVPDRHLHPKQHTHASEKIDEQISNDLFMTQPLGTLCLACHDHTREEVPVSRSDILLKVLVLRELFFLRTDLKIEELLQLPGGGPNLTEATRQVWV